MPSTRSRCLRLCLALGLVVSVASLLLDLGAGYVALLDLAPFLTLLVLTLVWPEASARLLEKVVVAEEPRPRAARRKAPLRPLRAEGDSGRLLVCLHGARGPPLGLGPVAA